MKVSLKEIIAIHHSSLYLKTEANQTLIINLPNTLKIKITVANDVFEWFVDIYNSKEELLISKWFDHYDNTEENLIEEMKNGITAFVKDITENKTRIKTEQNFRSVKPVFQVFENDIWVDYF